MSTQYNKLKINIKKKAFRTQSWENKAAEAESANPPLDSSARANGTCEHLTV